MIDSAAAKQAFKDATDDEAKALYGWATACMEARGLIAIEGAPTRKRRIDAGVQRAAKSLLDSAPNAAQPTVEGVRERLGEQHTLLGEKHQ